jgi:non-ribosomal peptide synthetase component F
MSHGGKPQIEIMSNFGVLVTAGPTEVTVLTVNHTFEPGANVHMLGRPDHNVHAYVVDAKLRQVPVGVPGELLLSGPRMGRGYIGRPDITAEKFIQVGDQPGQARAPWSRNTAQLA